MWTDNLTFAKQEVTAISMGNTRWFKYDWDWFVCKQVAVSPGHIWTTLYKYMIHITCPAIPFGIIARNERLWYNKIYTHLNGIICKHNYHLVVWKHFFVHTKNVIQYLCITISFQKVYWYNNFQDKNVTHPSQATQQQAHMELLRNPPMMRMRRRWVYLHTAFGEPRILKHFMQKCENIRLHYIFTICFCHLQVFMWYSQSDDIYRETYGFCCTMCKNETFRWTRKEFRLQFELRHKCRMTSQPYQQIILWVRLL